MNCPNCDADLNKQNYRGSFNCDECGRGILVQVSKLRDTIILSLVLITITSRLMSEKYSDLGAVSDISIFGIFVFVLFLSQKFVTYNISSERIPETKIKKTKNYKKIRTIIRFLLTISFVCSFGYYSWLEYFQ